MYSTTRHGIYWFLPILTTFTSNIMQNFPLSQITFSWQHVFKSSPNECFDFITYLNCPNWFLNMVTLQVVWWLAMRGTQLLIPDNFICTFDRELTHACVCPSLDVLPRSITQCYRFNNLSFMGEKHLINQRYSPGSCGWINKGIHCFNCRHCRARGQHLKR